MAALFGTPSLQTRTVRHDRCPCLPRHFNCRVKTAFETDLLPACPTLAARHRHSRVTLTPAHNAGDRVLLRTDFRRRLCGERSSSTKPGAGKPAPIVNTGDMGSGREMAPRCIPADQIGSGNKKLPTPGGAGLPNPKLRGRRRRRRTERLARP